MRSLRQKLLLLTAFALLGLRWWTWSGDVSVDAAPDVVSAVSTRAPPARPQGMSIATSGRSGRLGDISAGTRDLENESPRDPFAVRKPPPPPPPPPVATAPAHVPVITPLAPPARPVAESPVNVPPPLQVVGSWRDEAGSSVFLVTPRGIVHVREDDVLMGEYRLIRLTPQQLLLQHLSSKRDAVIPVPPAAQSTLTNTLGIPAQ